MYMFVKTNHYLRLNTRDIEGEPTNEQLKDIRKRLYKIEDKLDHVLYHHGHDVTPHQMTLGPYGMMMTPNTKNPNSAHNQLKMGDHMMNPFMGGGMMGGMMHPGMMGGMMHPGMMGGMMHPGMMGGMMHPGMMGGMMHPGMMGGMGMMHPGMMGGMGMMHPGMMGGMPMGMMHPGMGMPMSAFNYPDHSEVESGNMARKLKEVTPKKKRRNRHHKKKRNKSVARFMF